MRALLPALVLSAVGGGLTACGGGTETTTLRNEGVACVDLAAGTVEIDFNTCLSSSCDTLVSSSCTATLSAGTITVEAEAVIESDTTGDCTTDCGFTSATCDLPEGGEQASTLAYAGVSEALEDAACTDGGA